MILLCHLWELELFGDSLDQGFHSTGILCRLNIGSNLAGCYKLGKLLLHVGCHYCGKCHLALRVDEIHGREPLDVVGLGDVGLLPLFVLAEHAPLNLILCAERLQLLLVGVEGHTDEFHHVAIFLIDILHRWNLLATVGTPCSPEVEHYPTARTQQCAFLMGAVRRQRKRRLIGFGFLEYKIGSLGSHFEQTLGVLGIKVVDTLCRCS